MKNIKNAFIEAFLEVSKIFPFSGYMDNKMNKYFFILSQLIIKGYHPKSNIFSIGSGPCDLEAILSKVGYNITAIDDLKDQWHLIGKNRKRIRSFARQVNIELINQSAEKSQPKKNYFDVVLLIDVIEHLHGSPRELLNYSIASLKPGGLLLIETPNAVSLLKRLKMLCGKSSHISANFLYWNIGEYRSHIREYTLSELKEILPYHYLDSIDSKMINLGTFEGLNFPINVIVKTCKLISGLYPNFRDTILVAGKKPKNWHPTDNSINNFKKYYPHIINYNLDNEPDAVLINEMKNPHS